MGRNAKRVPLTFDWPLKETWDGYLMPKRLHPKDCESCDAGYSPEASLLLSRWYGNAPFMPEDNGSTPFPTDHPAIWSRAERNVAGSPEFYGTDPRAVHREAVRLAQFYNSKWQHHLNDADVAVLLDAGRLHDLTHTWSKANGWEPTGKGAPTAREVNEWSLGRFGHDSTNAYYCIKARCEADSLPYVCSTCGGEGSIERWPGQRAEAEAWEPTEPPTGDGWQMWEDTSEGSPISPVFASADELAHWCADNATWFGASKASVSDWLRVIVGGESAMLAIAPGVVVM